MSQKIVIFGSGELAEVVLYYFENEERRSVAGFVVDDEVLWQVTCRNFGPN
jgi:hypothetical protein